MLKKSTMPYQIFRILPGIERKLCLHFSDSTFLGYLPKQMNQTLSPLIGSLSFEMEAWVPIIAILDAISNVNTSAEPAIRVNIHVYGHPTSKDQIGKHLSKGKLFLQHPDMCRPGTRYDNPQMLVFDDLGAPDFEEDAEVYEEMEIPQPVEYDGEFEEMIATVFQSLRRGDNLSQIKGAENLTRPLYP